MKLGKLSGAVSFFGTGVIDQMVLSAANFLAGLLMIRLTSDVAYGQFVLAQSAILLLVSTQGAWLTGPLAIVVPKKTPAEKTLAVGAMRFSQSRFLRRVGIAVLLATALAWIVGVLTASTALVMGAILLACWAALQREFLRGVLIMYTRQRQLLSSDTIYAAAMVIGVLAASLISVSSGIYAIAALIIAACIAEMISYRMLSANPGWASGDAKPWWKEIRPIGLWATVGSLIYWVFGQSYNYILAASFDLTAVSSVNAARLLLTPIFVFTIGINNVLVFRTANWLAEVGLSKTLSRLALVLVILSALDLIYVGVIWGFRDWLIADVLHKTIGNRDTLLLLWASIALIFLPREILQAVLFASGQAKSMTWLIGVSAAVSLSVTGYGIAIGQWGSATVLIGQIAGECTNVLGLSFMLWRHIRLKRALAPN